MNPRAKRPIDEKQSEAGGAVFPRRDLHKESNNLATIILAMRHVAGYGSG
jgi:hypothetical protein